MKVPTYFILVILVYHMFLICYPHLWITYRFYYDSISFMGLVLALFKYGSKRRSRHLRSQMKYYAGSKFKQVSANATWSFANTQARRYGNNGLFGIN